MTLRRISLTLALLSAPSWADDVDELDDPTHHVVRTIGRESATAAPDVAIEDVLLRSDGSVASLTLPGARSDRSVPWNLVRLVLPDVAAEAGDDAPMWIAVRPGAPPAAPHGHRAGRNAPADELVSLRALTGLPVTNAAGELVGFVRGAMLCVPSGNTPALAVELGPIDGSTPRVVAVPWSMLDVLGATRAGVVRLAEGDSRWLRAAPAIDWSRATRAEPATGEDHAANHGFSPRFDGADVPDPLFGAWSDPR